MLNTRTMGYDTVTPIISSSVGSENSIYQIPINRLSHDATIKINNTLMYLKIPQDMFGYPAAQVNINKAGITNTFMYVHCVITTGFDKIYGDPYETRNIQSLNLSIT